MAWCVRGSFGARLCPDLLWWPSFCHRLSSHYYFDLNIIIVIVVTQYSVFVRWRRFTFYWLEIPCIILCRLMYRTWYFIDSRGDYPAHLLFWLCSDTRLRYPISTAAYFICVVLFMMLRHPRLLSYIEEEDRSILWAHHYYYDVYVLLNTGRDAFIPSTCYIAPTHWLLWTLSDLTLFCHHLWNHGMLSY